MGSIYITGDMGDIWERTRQPDGTKLNRIEYFDNSIFVTCDESRTLRSDNDGRSWSSSVVSEDNLDLKSIEFSDNNSGFILGNSMTDNNNAVIYTDDAGITWKEGFVTKKVLHDICFPGNNYGILLVEDKVLFTNDRGLNWIESDSEIKPAYVRLFFLDKDLGWAVGKENGIWKTGNSGKTWDELSSISDLKINDVFFIDNTKGWAVGNNGLFLYTTDGGSSWYKLETGILEDYISVFFINYETGMVGGRNGTLLKVEILP
ncbi:WD40/YVTN/BNR-like repeat-containing protein [candidate division KSB1 bacterium]